jgi:arylsulfatase A-like enzyme
MKKFFGRFTGVPPALLALTALTGFRDTPQVKTETHPNILLIMVDQMQTPPEGYGPNEGAAQGLKEILGFRPITAGNSYTQYFDGLMRLRQNAVVLKKHYTASAASVPSRSCIMTGQYATETGVTQTDGLFKSTADVPFLDSIGTPTIGDWFRAIGYKTHYFGKWHVSEAEPPDYLEPWGFSDFERSYPEPHGGTSSNLGAFRDVLFTEQIVEFLNNKSSDTSGIPWLTVASLVNPHDVSSWPINWMVPGGKGVVPWTNYPPPPSIPAMGDKSRNDTVMTVINGDTVQRVFQVDLNPDGFPQNNSFLPRTYRESLASKPWCQQDNAVKWGLAWGANADYTFIQGGMPFRSPHPFQLQEEYDSTWALSYYQFYMYCHYLADLQLRKILQALDENDLTDNTIVVFLSDHGDMASAHGGTIQKWHNAYEETVRVPMVISSPLVNENSEVMREILQPTSSIDLAPTLLAFAGYKEAQLRSKMVAAHGRSAENTFPGADLSSHIKGETTGSIIGPDGNPRTGVLFMGNDKITELGEINPGGYKTSAYNLFLDRVDSLIALGYPMAPGTVRRPNDMLAFCTGDWKIVQYKDPNGAENDQWELYCLTSDPVEEINLVDYLTGEVREDVNVPGMTREELILKNDYLKEQLANATNVAEIAPSATQIKLFGNMPNPFSQRTTISFSIPDNGPVQLSVTDLSGNVVQVILNQTLPIGFHNYDFDAGLLPSGVYLIRLNFNSQLAVQKIILMK